jgi:uncharacterized protein (TIGR02246 family)
MPAAQFASGTEFDVSYIHGMQPKEVVRAWVDTFNRGDAKKLATFYADDAVNHQVANEPIVGRSAIRAMFKREFANANMVCQT